MQHNPPDYFADPVPVRHIGRPRPWPEISGSRQDLDRALDHFFYVAEANDIQVGYTDDKRFTDVGLYYSSDRSILMHSDLRFTPGLYAFVLAHELAHAFDPILHVIEHPYYGTTKADIEALSEASAIRALMEWGLTLRNELSYLNWTDELRHLSWGWRERFKSQLADRYRVVLTPLLPPLADEQAQHIRDQKYRESWRQVDREARRILRDRERKARRDQQRAADAAEFAASDDAFGKWVRGAAWKGFKRLL